MFRAEGSSPAVKLVVVALIVAGLILPLVWSAFSRQTSILLLLAIVAGIVVLGLASRRRNPSEEGSSPFLSRTRFLCDRCKYNDPRDCSRPERPNAERCPDFRSR